MNMRSHTSAGPAGPAGPAAGSSAGDRQQQQSLTLTEAPGGPPRKVLEELKNLDSTYIRQLVIDCMHELEDRSVAYWEAQAIGSKREDRDQRCHSSKKRQDRDHR